MVRISHEQLVEHWAMTYGEDGYRVRANHVTGLEAPERVNNVSPDIEATKDQARVLIVIIDSPECLEAPETRAHLQALDAARDKHTSLHVVIAAECGTYKQHLDEWNIHPDTVHMT